MHCRSVFLKESLQEKIEHFAGPGKVVMTGTGTCSKCQAVYQLSDIYTGKHDVPRKYWPQLPQPVQIPGMPDVATETVATPAKKPQSHPAPQQSSPVTVDTRIHFACKCGEKLWAQESFAGKKAKCSKCGLVVEIPIDRIPKQIARCFDTQRADKDRRLDVYDLCGNADDPRVERALIQMLQSSDYYTRLLSARALSERIFVPNRTAFVDALAGVLTDSQADTRVRAAQALYQIGPKASSAVPALIDRLQDPVFSVRIHCVHALGAIGADAERVVPLLVDLLKSAQAGDKGSVAARGAANLALGAFGDRAQAAIPVLINELTVAELNTPGYAAEALGQIGGTNPDQVIQALTQLITRAESGDEFAAGGSREAIKALGNFGQQARAAIPYLKQASQDIFLNKVLENTKSASFWKDRASEIRQAAAEALQRIE